MEISDSYRSQVLEQCDPERWQSHRFGLSEVRWRELQGGVFWVTGAGTGFGRAIATALAAAGSRVVMSGRRLAMLEQARDSMAAMDISVDGCYLLPVDLMEEDKIELACREIKERYGQLNGLVNGAAVPNPVDMERPLEQGDRTLWDKIIGTNLTAPWLLTRLGWPLLLASGRPRVVFISSEAAWAGAAGMGMYNISKAGLNSLCFSMAMELQQSYPDRDVQLNTVIPGVARTEMNPTGPDSPFTIVGMVLTLLSQGPGGPNGKFFHRNGGHIRFGYARPYERPL